MPKEREKVKCKTELEFITEVADDCVANLKDKDREHLIRNPYAIDYYFSYCLYIRNHYIHNRDFSDVDFWTEPDDLSSEIIRMIFAKLIPEYDYDNQFIENLKEWMERRVTSVLNRMISPLTLWTTLTLMIQQKVIVTSLNMKSVVRKSVQQLSLPRQRCLFPLHLMA